MRIFLVIVPADASGSGHREEFWSEEQPETLPKGARLYTLYAESIADARRGDCSTPKRREDLEKIFHLGT